MQDVLTKIYGGNIMNEKITKTSGENSKRHQPEETKVIHHILQFTAKTQYQKFETNIPRKGIARPLSQFPHSCVSVIDLYIPRIGLPILLQENMWTDSRNI
jgi:hypothetical protein